MIWKIFLRKKYSGKNYPRGYKNFEQALQSNMMMQNHTEEIILKELWVLCFLAATFSPSPHSFGSTDPSAIVCHYIHHLLFEICCFLGKYELMEKCWNICILQWLHFNGNCMDFLVILTLHTFVSLSKFLDWVFRFQFWFCVDNWLCSKPRFWSTKHETIVFKIGENRCKR